MSSCNNKNSIRSPLARARNSGANGHGAIHWIRQRFTALIMIPLLAWFLFAIPCVVTEGYEGAHAWLQSPINATGFILFILASFWHAALGLQVVIEDYVHCAFSKPALIFGVFAGCSFMAISCIVAILKITIGN